MMLKCDNTVLQVWLDLDTKIPWLGLRNDHVLIRNKIPGWKLSQLEKICFSCRKHRLLCGHHYKVSRHRQPLHLPIRKSALYVISTWHGTYCKKKCWCDTYDTYKPLSSKWAISTKKLHLYLHCIPTNKPIHTTLTRSISIFHFQLCREIPSNLAAKLINQLQINRWGKNCAE